MPRFAIFHASIAPYDAAMLSPCRRYAAGFAIALLRCFDALMPADAFILRRDAAVIDAY